MAASVSIALATYNGARFLETQLATIRAQTRLPDEMVVCDDGSTDGTPEIVEQFAAQAPFEVRLVRNDARLGHARNFLQAGRLCRSDVVAWCDQDDEWMPEKLDRSVQEFEKDPDVVLVVHSRQIGDMIRGGGPAIRAPGGEWVDGRNRRRVLVRSVRTPTSSPLDTRYPGQSTLISRRVLEIEQALAARLPDVVVHFAGHDRWTSFLAQAMGKLVLLPDVLVKYRQHTEQATGGARLPASSASRVRTSAGRSEAEVEADLQHRVTRAFFRASVLVQLAAQLDIEAGSERSAADLRADLYARYATQVDNDTGLALGALARADMWRRHGEALRRRLELWRQRPASAHAVSCLVRGISSGDYGDRERGGLGAASFVRDLAHVADVRRALARS